MSVLSVMPKQDSSTDHCPGSGKIAQRKGSKYIRHSLRFKCPDCGGYYAKDNAGRLNKHGYKLGAVKSTVSWCGGCSKKFEGLDYLCPKCRIKDEKKSKVRA